MSHTVSKVTSLDFTVSQQRKYATPSKRRTEPDFYRPTDFQTNSWR
jgi:hypothetical protein